MGKRESLPKSGRKDINLSVKLGEDHQHALEIIWNRLAPGQPLDKSKAVRHAILETARIDPAFLSISRSVQVFKDPRIEEVLEIVSKLASGLSQTQSAINMLLEKKGAEEKSSSQPGSLLPEEGGPSSVIAEKWRQVLLKNSKMLADAIRADEAVFNPESVRDLEGRLPGVASFACLAFEQGTGSLSFQYLNSLFIEKEKVHLLVGSLADYRNPGTFKKFPHKLGFLALRFDLGQLPLKVGATYRFSLRNYSRATQIYEVIQDPNPKCNEPAMTTRSVASFPLVA